MNARTIRRAQERKAAKQARQAAERANRAAAVVPDGQTLAGLDAAQVPATVAPENIALPLDSGYDAEAYSQLVGRMFAQWRPVGDDERRLVQCLADTEWRLLRIPVIESGIYAIGRLEFAAEFAREPDIALRRSRIDARVFLTYQRELKNLSTHEGRLRRQREKDSAELRRLQQERTKQPGEAPANGCEFSTEPVSSTAGLSPVASVCPDMDQQLSRVLNESGREHVTGPEQPRLYQLDAGFHASCCFLQAELLQIPEF